MQWSDLLEPLDWSRQAATNTGEGLSGLLGGDFSRDNFAKVLPGVAGLAAGALTGGTMAIPAGALTAALVQGAGKAFNPQAMKALSTQDLVSRLGGDPDSTWQNIGMHVATDPLSYAGLGLMGGGAKAAEAAGAGSKLGNMLAARRGIAGLDAMPGTGTIVGETGAKLGSELEGMQPELTTIFGGQGTRGASGISPTTNTPWMARSAMLDAESAKEATRHELYHSLVSKATQQPTSANSGLGLLGRSATDLYRGSQPQTARNALAVLLDETGAHAAEAGSSPLKQALGGADFLFGRPGSNIDRAFYSNQLRAMSPTVGRLYDALGVAPKAVAGGGLGAGAFLGGRQLFQE